MFNWLESIDMLTFSKKILVGGILVSGGLFLGLLLTNLMTGNFFATSQSPLTVKLVETFGDALLDPGTLVSGIFLAALTCLLIIISPCSRRISVYVPPLINLMIYLFISSFTIYRLPGVVLSALLFILCLISSDKNRIQTNLRFFWLFFICFLFLQGAGIYTGISGIDPIRQHIPVSVQVVHTIVYLNAFMVYYAIRRTCWGIGQFETFSRIFMVFASVIALESVLSFYLKIGNEVSLMGHLPLFDGKMFQSRLIGYYHFVGRIGIAFYFLSLYFWFKHKKRKDAVCIVLGAMLVFSTANRQVILSTVIGTALLFFSALWYRIRQAESPVRAAKFIFFAVVILLCVCVSAIFLSKQTMKVRENYQGKASFQLAKRSMRLARGIDAFKHTFPLGSGAGLNSYYMGSRDVDWAVTEKVAGWLGYTLDYAQWLISPNDLEKQYGLHSAHTIHNLWMRVMIEFGLAGLLFVGGLGIRMVAQGFRLLQEPSPNYHKWAVFSMVAALFISLFFTVKFRHFWFLALMFLFLESLMKQNCAGSDA